MGGQTVVSFGTHHRKEAQAGVTFRRMRPRLARANTLEDIADLCVNFWSALSTFTGGILRLLPRLGNRAVTGLVYGTVASGGLYIFVQRGYAGLFVESVQRLAIGALGLNHTAALSVPDL